MNCNEVIKLPNFIFWKIDHREPVQVWADVVHDDFNVVTLPKPIGVLTEIKTWEQSDDLDPFKTPAEFAMPHNLTIDNLDAEQSQTMDEKNCWKWINFLIRDGEVVNHEEIYVIFTSNKFYQNKEVWLKALGYNYRSIPFLSLSRTRSELLQNHTKCIIGIRRPLVLSHHLKLTFLPAMFILAVTLIGVLIYYCYSHRAENRVYPTM